MNKIGVILAGGKSRRFGEDKAFFPVAGRPMVSWVAKVLEEVFDVVIVAGGDVARYEKIGLTCFEDPVPNKGALGGIYNALCHTKADAIFLCGCDMPLLHTGAVKAVLDCSSAEDLVLPIVGGIRQPLHALYNRSMFGIVERLVKSAEAFLPELFEEVTVRKLDETALGLNDTELQSFVSMNDRETLKRYSKQLSSLK